MEIVKMKTNMLSRKLIAHVSPDYAKAYNLPEGHQSVGMFTVDNDDVGYLMSSILLSGVKWMNWTKRLVKLMPVVLRSNWNQFWYGS